MAHSSGTWEVECGPDHIKGIYDPSKMLSYKRGDCILENGSWVTLHKYCSLSNVGSDPNWKWRIQSCTDPKRKIAHIFDSTRKRPHRVRCTCKPCKEWIGVSCCHDCQGKKTKPRRPSRKPDASEEPPTKRLKTGDDPITLLEDVISHIDRSLAVPDEESASPTIAVRLTELRTDVERLKKELARPATECLRIGVEGPSGVGKSTLLNALLNEDNLLTVSGYEACTAVPIQICSSDRDGEYSALVELVTKQEWLKELRCLFEEAQSGDLADDDDDDDGEGEAVTRQIALAKCKAVYGDLDFKTLTFERLSATENEVTKLLDSTKRETENVLPFTAETGKALSDQLEPYISSVSDPEDVRSPAREYWPLVKSVTITIPTTEYLPANVVLVDLPGISDSNQARRAVTKNFIKECNRIWVVCVKTRTTTERSFQEQIGKQIFRQLKLDGFGLSLSVICTMTDDVSNVEQEIRRLGLEETAKDEDLEKKLLLVAKHRNAWIKKKVKTCCTSLVPRQKQSSESQHAAGGASGTDPISLDVPTFTVSARDYLCIQKLSQDKPTVFTTKETLEDTEIPQLQRYVRKQYEEANRKAVERQTIHASTILERLREKGTETEEQRRVAESAYKGLKTQTIKATEVVKRRFQSQADKCFGKLEEAFTRGVQNAKGKSQEAADRLHEKVRMRTLRAICLRDGEFPTAKRGTMKISFNSDLAEPIIKQVENVWTEVFHPKDGEGSFYTEATSAANLLASEFSKHFEQAAKKMKDNGIDEARLKGVKRNRDWQLDDTTEQLKSIIAEEQKDAHRLIESSIQTDLKKTYEACAGFSGDGTLVKMRTQIKDGVAEASQEKMFENAANRVLTHLREFLMGRLQHVIYEFGRNLCSEHVFQHMWQVPDEAQAFAEESSKLEIEELLQHLIDVMQDM